MYIAKFTHGNYILIIHTDYTNDDRYVTKLSLPHQHADGDKLCIDDLNLLMSPYCDPLLKM